MPDSRDLYKTKLCVLYQRGNCHRNSCSFAHGEAELRKLPGRNSYYRGSYSRRSPGRRFERRNFYDRDSRSRSPTPQKSLSSPRSTGQKRSGSDIDREGEGEAKKLCKAEHQSELSEVRAAHGDAHSDVKEVQSDFLTEQLHKAEADLEILDSQKNRMEKALENASQEIQRLSSRIDDYEAKMAQVELSNKKLEKFQKACIRFVRSQEEFKRAEMRLQKLVDDEDDYRRPSLDPVYEVDQDNSHKWKGRTTNGPVANGIDGKHRKSGFDDRDITDNGSDGHTFIETGF